MKVNIFEAIPLLIVGVCYRTVQVVYAILLLIIIFVYHIWTGKPAFPFGKTRKSVPERCKSLFHHGTWPKKKKEALQ